MKKSKFFLITVALLVFMSVFGAWTNDTVTETRYADAPLVSIYADETINYTRKEIVAENTTDGDCPMYTSLSDLSNACGAVAGAEIVAYYDKYFPELIPDWTSYYTANGRYRKQDSTYVPALMRDLYTLMRTNVDDVGVNRTDFLNGLTSYVNGKGYQISYQSVKSGNAIDFAQCQNAIDKNKVIAVLVLPTTVYSIKAASGNDVLTPINITGAHIMVAYGYLKINYYNASGLFRTDTYLRVAMGRSGATTALYKVNSTTTEAAYIVNVQ